MKSNAVRRETQETAGNQRGHDASGNGPRSNSRDHSIRPPSHTNGNTDHLLRMYTEEEVSEMLQVSLSQLRKWRMRKEPGATQGPPFRKIGRLVRYPGIALEAYINGEDQHSQPNQESASALRRPVRTA